MKTLKEICSRLKNLICKLLGVKGVILFLATFLLDRGDLPWGAWLAVAILFVGNNIFKYIVEKGIIIVKELKKDNNE